MSDIKWSDAGKGGGPFIRLCNTKDESIENTNNDEPINKVKKNMFTINNILSKRKLSNTKRITTPNKSKVNINVINKKEHIDMVFTDSNLLDYIDDLKVNK